VELGWSHLWVLVAADNLSFHSLSLLRSYYCIYFKLAVIDPASEMTYIVSGGALNSTHSLTYRSIHSTSPSMFHPRFQHDIQTMAAVFYLTSSGHSARSSLYCRKACVSGFWCHRLERPASPRRICAVTCGFQTTTPDLSVFPFLPRHYHMTRVLQLPFITTVWTPVVLTIIDII